MSHSYTVHKGKKTHLNRDPGRQPTNLINSLANYAMKIVEFFVQQLYIGMAGSLVLVGSFFNYYNIFDWGKPYTREYGNYTLYRNEQPVFLASKLNPLYTKPRYSPTTVGSRSTKTARGTCLPAPVSEKKVLKESSPPPMVLSLGICPSGWNTKTVKNIGWYLCYA